ncbi:unnamed protein product [Prunus armeniaca]
MRESGHWWQFGREEGRDSDDDKQFAVGWVEMEVEMEVDLLHCMKEMVEVDHVVVESYAFFQSDDGGGGLNIGRLQIL